MKLIKKYPSGKTKIDHNGLTIFIKSFEDGDQNWSAGWIISAPRGENTEAEAREAFELATGNKDYSIYRSGRTWEARIK